MMDIRCFYGRSGVFLFGQSMLLSLVAGSLTENPNLRVIHEKPGGSWRRTAECLPDVLIYDLPCASEGNILPLLSRNPRLLLIGLDMETNRAVLIAGQETVPHPERREGNAGSAAEPALNTLPVLRSKCRSNENVNYSGSISRGGVLENAPLEIKDSLKPPVPPGVVGN